MNEPVLVLVLCLNCEEHQDTNLSAVRRVTSKGRCATCGSESVLRMPARRRDVEIGLPQDGRGV